MTISLPPRVRRALKRWRWMVPGLGVKRYVVVISLGVLLLLIGFVQFARTGPASEFWNATVSWLAELSRSSQMPRWWAGLTLAGLGLLVAWLGVVGLNRSILRAVGTGPGEALEQIFVRRALKRGPKLVAIGGGTGLSNLLAGLKIFSANLTGIVAVTDDGGSSGRLRQSLGMPAPGDLTDCFAALSDSPILSKLLLHRFSRGDGLEGHTFGNLLLATLSEERGDFAEAALAVNEILNVRGGVVPATGQAVVLVSELDDGRRIMGESRLRLEKGEQRVKCLRLEPAQPPALPEAIEAIRTADLLVIGPGSLYTSVIPPLLVPDLAAALRASTAPIAYVANIMTEAGETDGMSALDHCQAVAEHLGRMPDLVVINSAPVSDETLERYRHEHAELVEVNDAALRQAGLEVFRAPLTRGGSGQHDPRALSVALLRLLAARRFGFRVRAAPNLLDPAA